jgi:hypothetical protein
MRSPYGPDGYGPEKYKEFDGRGLFSQMRAVCGSQLTNVKPQRLQIKWAKHDGPKLRARECVAKYLRLVTPLRRVK